MDEKHSQLDLRLNLKHQLTTAESIETINAKSCKNAEIAKPLLKDMAKAQSHRALILPASTKVNINKAAAAATKRHLLEHNKN